MRCMPRVRYIVRLDKARVDRITIDGFKSIRSQTISLGRLNVFIGANGSGKTALLEAIGVLGAAAYGRVDDVELMRRGVRPGVPQLFKSAFEGETSGSVAASNRSSQPTPTAVLRVRSPRWGCCPMT
jgi:recombinational DNA repair ATPase RecF